MEDLESICRLANAANYCDGNNEFIELLESRGGEIKNVSHEVVAFLDREKNTVRHQNCTILCVGVRCQTCTVYRATLRAMKSRSKKLNSEDKQHRSSHTNYRYLQANELTARLRNVQRAKRIVERNNMRLEEKLHSTIEHDGIDLLEEMLVIFKICF
jgi:predicted secreted protein